MDRFELAWAAGFFDGEGWANAIGGTGRRTRQPNARVNQAGPAGVPEALIRFQRALDGLGRIGGPLVAQDRRDLYRWEVTSRRDVTTLHDALRPWLGQVKLNEFANALGVRAVAASCSQSDEEWLAWAAGLFDGEGWVSMYAHRSHVGFLSAEIGVGQSGADGEPEVLQRFLAVVRRAKIYGPYEQIGATMPVYRWKAAALDDVVATIELLWPRLGALKRADAALVREILAGQQV